MIEPSSIAVITWMSAHTAGSLWAAWALGNRVIARRAEPITAARTLLACIVVGGPILCIAGLLR